MTDLEKADRYRQEAGHIVARGEDIVLTLKKEGACEGHVLMASQILSALRRLDRLIEEHGKRVAASQVPDVDGQSIATYRSWWSVIKWPSRNRASLFEANISLSDHGA